MLQYVEAVSRDRFASMKDLLPGVLSGLAREGGPVSALGPVWNEVAGAPACLHSRPVAIERGTWVIEVSSPAWARELELSSKLLLERLGEKLGRGAPSELRFRLPERK